MMVGIARKMSDGAFKSAVGKQYQWKFPNALDQGDVTWNLFGVSTQEQAVGVVIGPDGRVVDKRGFNWFVSDGPNKGKLWIHDVVDKVMAKQKSGAGGGVPAKAKPVADLLKLGEFGKALAAARKLGDKPEDVAAYRDTIVPQLEDMKKARMDEIQALAADDARKFQALQAAECFLKAFGGEKDAQDVKSTVQKLKTDAAVKRELSAKDLFFRAADCLSGNKAQQASAFPILDKLRADYADTTFGKYADTLATQ